VRDDCSRQGVILMHRTAVPANPEEPPCRLAGKMI
jgi:hypothetical protein